jgi:diguanylate cyclase (GGDEF)-like protein
MPSARFSSFTDRLRSTHPAQAAVSVVVVNGVLAVPSILAPQSLAAAVSYLLGFAVTVAVLWAVACGSNPDRRTWQFISAAATCWLLGDLVERFVPGWERVFDGAGVPDVLWLCGYPLLALGVLHRVRGRGLHLGTWRELLLDCAALTVSAGVVAWQLIVVPAADPDATTLSTAVSVLYPLGDVLLFAMVCVLALAPGSRAGDRLLGGWLVATLVIDASFTLLPAVLPHLEAERLDGVLLIVNSLLAAAALRPPVTEGGPARDTGQQVMPVSRVVLLGAGVLIAPGVACLSPNPDLGTRLLLALAAMTVSVIVLVRLFGVVRARETAEQFAALQASRDGLTGLANRSFLARHADGILGEPDRAVRSALLFVDVDHFKMVNDVHGHAFGDEALRVVASRLRAAVRPDDIVARIGGDEFVVLCANLTKAGAQELAERVTRAGTGQICVEDTCAEISISVGSVHGTDLRLLHEDTALADLDIWLHAADVSMFIHKRSRDSRPRLIDTPT